MASYLFKWHIPHIWFIALRLIGGSFPHLSQAQDSLAQSRPASQGHPVALSQIILKDGGDDSEAYLRALYETQYLQWRPKSRRIVILFGDTQPHDPDPGPDGELETE